MRYVMGEILSSCPWRPFGYNSRSELIEALMGTNNFSYRYDPIGNRTVATNNGAVSEYLANSLNQYSAISNQQSQIPPAYDLDGNLTNDGRFAYSWDAENRMTGASNGTTVANYSYDYMSRRYRKIVNGVTNNFSYDGWNLISEISVGGTQSITNRYVWGLDLSGTQQGAGGIGGLLSVTRNGVTYYPCYDANGNISEYVDASGAVVAHREYDAYGNTVASSGQMVNDFNFWFSSKYLDQETGLYYYGYRQYIPELGRWASRDPIGEPGGKLLYGFVLNRPINATDSHGLFAALYPVLKALFGDCLKKLIEEKMIDGVSKYGDKLNACSAILAESKTPEFSDKICDGITVSKNMESIYKKKSLAGLIVECMGSKAKSWGLDKLLKDATTDLEKKIVKELFELTVEDAAKKIDVGESKTVMNTTAACNKDKIVEIHLTYVTTWTVDGASIPLQSNDETPFTCGGFLTGAFNNMCKCCGDKK